ncbi:DUF6177 family protein [Frondihabitans peucedani]|uniref:DUF6177 family protein n=1 Tax=Frondihabitans peucedani TaxID=598626 RepID=UPI0031D9D557
MGIPIRHPLIDDITSRAVRVESRATVVRLSAPFADLLARPVAAGRRIALVTPETSRITIGLRSALVAAGGIWLARTPSGFRDGITGVDHATLDEAVGSPDPSLDPAASGLHQSTVHSAEQVTTQLSVDVTLLHSASHDPALGGAVEAVAMAVGGYHPQVWGASEPLEKTWDRWAMTQDARHRAPSTSRYLVEGERFSAAVTARVTDRGIEETIALTADVPGGSAGLDAAIGRLGDALGGLTRSSLPTFALVLAREGEPDRCFRPLTYPPPNPVVLLIGAPSVERFDLHERTFADEQHVRVVGRPRKPAYLLSLGDSFRSGWEALHDALDSVGSERVTTSVEPPLLQAWEDDLHGDLERHGEPHPHGERLRPTDSPRGGETDAP